MIVDYGGGIPWDRITYEDYIGLEMNRNHAALRRTYWEALAHSLASGVGDVPYDVVRAACDSDEIARRLAAEMSNERVAAAKGF
jgi:hypothetical protein